jgi:hypothetical protein
MKITDQLRRMGLDDDQIAHTTIDGKPVAEADKPGPVASDGWPGYRSKWEALYAVDLDYQKSAGDIIEWMYESITFKLTEATIVEGKRKRAITYTPDFVCWLPDGRIRCVEVKGFQNTQAINRFKLAKDKFRQFEFLMVSRNKGSWGRIL